MADFENVLNIWIVTILFQAVFGSIEFYINTQGERLSKYI